MLRRLAVPLTVVVLVATSVTLSTASPAVAGSARSATVASSRPVPVLLVHGFRGSSRGWHALEASLRATGYRDAEIDAIDYDSDASNVSIARDIAREADALRARTGASRIDVVTHSMGAISTRYWMDHLGGAAEVAAFVSLAGVNEGTIWAYGCYVLTPCREMVPTSSVLDGLRSARATDTTRYGAWWSPCDEAIIPRTNAELPGAHNFETACLDHTEMRTDPQVVEQVVQFLRPDGLDPTASARVRPVPEPSPARAMPPARDDTTRGQVSRASHEPEAPVNRRETPPRYGQSRESRGITGNLGESRRVTDRRESGTADT